MKRKYSVSNGVLTFYPISAYARNLSAMNVGLYASMKKSGEQRHQMSLKCTLSGHLSNFFLSFFLFTLLKTLKRKKETLLFLFLSNKFP